MKWHVSGARVAGPGLTGRLLGFVFLFASAAFAQSSPQSAPVETPPTTQPSTQPAVERERTGTLSASEIEKLIAQVDASTDSSAAQKEETKNLLKQAQDQLRLVESWEAKIAESQARILAAPTDLQRFRAEIEQFTPTTLPATQDETIEVLSSRLNAASTELRNAQSALEKLNSDAETRRDRREQLARLIEAANANQAKAQAGLDQPSPPGLPASLIQARRVLWQEQQAAYRNEIRAYEEELRELSARADVFEARRELQRRVVSEQERIVADWQQRVDNRRQQEIQAQNQQIERELERAAGPLREIAEETAATVADRAKAGEAIKRLGELVARIETERTSFAQRFAQTQQTVAEAAFTELIGPEVAKLRGQLNELRNYSRELRARERELSAAVQRQVRLEEQRSRLRDEDAMAASVLAQLPAAEAERLGTQSRVKELLRVQRESVDQLNADYGTYIDRLSEYRRRLTALLALVAQADAFVERSSLWLRSHPEIQGSRWPNAYFDLKMRANAFAGLFDDVTRFLPVWALAGLVLLLLILFRPMIRRRLQLLGEKASAAATDSYDLTPRALVLTALLAAPIPLVLWFLGWRIPLAADPGLQDSYDFAHAVGAGAWAAAALAVPLQLIWHACRPGGLADRHLRFDISSLERVRWSLVGLSPVLVVCMLLLASASASTDPAWQDGPARLAFAGLMVGTFVLTERLLLPTSGIFSNRLRRHPTGLVYHTRWVWYVGLIAIPLVLLIVSLVGYHYTAVELFTRMRHTLWVLLGAFLAKWIVMRFVFVAQRRLAVAQARSRREAAAAARAAEQRTEGETPAAMLPAGGAKTATAASAPIADEANIAVVGEQTQRVLGSLLVVALAGGFWIVWSDLLPALDFLNRYQVPTLPVTAGALLLAIIYTAITFVLAKNIPGLLEITILPRLPLDRGVRYAVVTIARYVIIVFGMVLTFGALGISWNSVQWLAAGVSVGLGFGLQEVFANFVSGLILLFERPIRVGDVVTVGDVSGVVTRIRIRATTILNWEHKEMLIPNRELVTGRVMNWSLSDRILRVLVAVNLGRDADARRACEIMAAAARRDPRVTTDPPPGAVFVRFSENGIDLEVRCWAKDLNDSESIKHDLLNAIHEEFRIAEIPFAVARRQVEVHNDGRTTPQAAE